MSGVPVEWPTADLLTVRASTTPERTALVDADTGESWTFRELHHRVHDLAARLDDYPGDGRVGLLLDRRVAVPLVFFAAMRRASSVVLFDPNRPADELAAQLERANCRVLVCGRETERRAFETVAKSADDVPTVSVDEPTLAAVDALDDGSSAVAIPYPLSKTNEQALLFTSGTTGRPKGVRLTVGNLVESAVGSAFRLGIDRSDRWLVCLPTYHMGGLAPFVRATLYGTGTVLQREFDPAKTAAVIETHDVTGVSLVPTMLRRLLDDGWSPPAQLRFVLLGGAAASQALLDRCADHDVPVYPTYGMTEAASQIATATPEQAREHPGTVGQPLVTTTVRVLDDAGDSVMTGEVGEIVVDGPTVTPGYLDDEQTETAFSQHGFHTGDVGYQDDAGRLWVTGRVDDRIVTGGENVDPSVVAEAIRSHPGVSAVAVVGLPDEEWGERVAALVVTGAAETVTGEDIEAHCKGRLAPHEVPKTVGFADELPRTASGTVDRDAVRGLLGD
ncbi:o-succinylbenzoate--CoA ligase [Haloarchaeobius sp. DYHT-AS-18]|uniref:o-succinylbenzoate--CoA ligase n=1 Tax=Haloarchaeobius sp. DYHT-AS-18 TaxID=3446117 RepID=UPI003EBE6A0F